MEAYNIDENTFIKITFPNGYMEIAYIDLLIQPPGKFRRARDYERWIRKIIKIAAKNGGWKIIRKEGDKNG